MIDRESGDRERPVKKHLEDLSKIYFSSNDEQAVGTIVRDTNRTVTFVPVVNLAGGHGEATLAIIRRSLEERGIGILRASVDGKRFRVHGEGERIFDGDGFLKHLAEEEASLILLQFGHDLNKDLLPLVCRGDIPIVLFGCELPDLVEAYRMLKSLSGIRGGTDPLLLPAVHADSGWESIAPLRLADAAEKFLNRRFPLWQGESPAECGRLLAERYDRMKARNENGVSSLIRRLAPLIGARA